MKKVAIILATYNGERYLSEQLESLRKQTYKNIKVYIHDDGSSDKTLDIIKEYVEHKRGMIEFELFSKKSLRYPMCFINTLLEIPKADYYAFCDQDDVWNEDKIEKAVKAIEKFGEESKPSLFYSAVDYYDGNLNYIRNARFIDHKKPTVAKYSLQEMLLGGEAMGMTFLFNNCLRDVMRTVVQNGGNDFKDTFMKIYCAAKGIVIYSSEPCAKYRRHASATTVGMNPAGKFHRLLNMANKIYLQKDGMASIQDTINYLNVHDLENMSQENKRIIELFAQPNTMDKKVKKVFYRGRFRLFLTDEIGYRVAFLFGRI